MADTTDSPARRPPVPDGPRAGDTHRGGSAAVTPPGPQEVLARVRDLVAGTVMERVGIEVREASPHAVVASMPVAGNTQPHGLLHGGVSCLLAESLASLGATLHAATLGLVAVGIELNASHHRSASSGRVTGTATALHLGRRLASYDVRVEDERCRVLCTARVTCLLVERHDAGLREAVVPVADRQGPGDED